MAGELKKLAGRAPAHSVVAATTLLVGRPGLGMVGELFFLKKKLAKLLPLVS